MSRREILSLAKQLAMPLVLFWVATVALQAAGGAFQNEFGGHPDEASHYITGLMVRDYVLGGDWAHPLRFAEDYYRHYPRVALGHWPPFFYIVQTVWTLLFGTYRLSMMLLMALVTALTALTLWRCARADFDAWTAWTVGLLYVALPLVQRYDAMLMADTLTALLLFWSALAFGRFLEHDSWSSAGAFGILASLAIMTKGSGICLAFVPPLALLFSRRFHLLGRLAFWLPALMVVVLCGPWYWFTMPMAAMGLGYSTRTSESTILAVQFFSRILVQAVGVGLFSLVAVGLFQRLIAPAWRRGARGKWAACGALLLCVWVFDWITPAPVGFEERFLVPALPALLLFLAAGMNWLADMLPARSRLLSGVVVCLGVAVVFAGTSFYIPADSCGGFDAAVQKILASPEFERANVLISSDAAGEGMFIAAVAERDRWPCHTILRASKVLGASDWLGHAYLSFCQSPREMVQLLQRLNVDVIVLDTSAPLAQDMAHHSLLAETIAAYPDLWQPLTMHDVLRKSVRKSQALHVYRLAECRGKS